MATSEELSEIYVSPAFQANMVWGITEMVRKCSSEPREDTSDPPYDQAGPAPDEREALARAIAMERLDDPERRDWIRVFGGRVLARERTLTKAAIEAFDADDWLLKIEEVTDAVAEQYTDLP